MQSKKYNNKYNCKILEKSNEPKVIQTVGQQIIVYIIS